ncbi:MAG: ATP-dependent DNA helicase RecG [Planctomycetota bacterium]|nr:ATP-dependent DNA helicase RecG [Planctomycetota bacterium]
MPAPRTASNDILDRPLQFMKGVGPKRAELLERLFLKNVRDLLYFFPVAHKDRASVTPVAHLRPGQEANVRAQIVDMRAKRIGPGREMIVATLQDESGTIDGVWWNPYVADKLPAMAWAFFSGKVIRNKLQQKQLANADFEILTSGEADDDEAAAAMGPASASFGRIVPVYSLRPKQRRPDGTEPPEVKLSQAFVRRMVWNVLEEGAAERIRDDLPEDLRSSRGLMNLSEAVRQFHFPESFAAVEQARRRLAFEELFVLSLGVALRREEIAKHETARRMPLTPAIHERIRARLPFELTEAQARAFREIAADLERARPMNRLLQGDVGCGKTAVALASMLLTVAHGAQAALLAPTEVLAEQHMRTFSKLLEGSRVKLGLLRGGATPAERRAFAEDLAAGAIHVAVGTHALLEESVQFKDLALVVVDEQHKFGVEQRRALRSKGKAPHVLVMTATPIPRSMSLTLYGDLDLSIIDALPPGRGEVVTRLMKEGDRPKVYKHLIAEARAGHATYVVLPRIEENTVSSEAPAPKPKAKTRAKAPKALWSEVKGVEEEVKRLREHLPTLRVLELHGRMPSEDKDRILTMLRDGKVDVLVSTQVIEVGIDLPSATIMLIENAERFGLSSLHQLRGRVGRGGLKGWCLVFGSPTTDDGKERLKAFAATNDGFQIAEADFRLRGPGQFFGTEQSGLPELVVADLLRDQRLLQEARDDAFALVRADPALKAAGHEALKKRVKDVFMKGGRLGLVDVG